MTRRSLALWLAATLGLAGAALHAWGFVTAGPKIGAANLSPFLKGAYGALWFADSLATAIVAPVALVAARRPGHVPISVMALLSAIPIGTGLLILRFIGPFYASYLQILIGVLLLAGSTGSSDRQAPQQ